MNLVGLTHMTYIMAFCANKPTNGGAYHLR